jgi:hypothetical protein
MLQDFACELEAQVEQWAQELGRTLDLAKLEEELSAVCVAMWARRDCASSWCDCAHGERGVGGQTLVIGIDGGRLRERRPKRGRKQGVRSARDIIRSGKSPRSSPFICLMPRVR